MNAARLQQRFHLLLRLEDDVHVAFGLCRVLLLARPLDADLAERFEDLHQRLLADVPGNAAEEDFRRVRDEAVRARRQNSAPCAAGVVQRGRRAMVLGSVVQSGTSVAVRLSPAVHLLCLSLSLIEAVQQLLLQNLLDRRGVQLLLELLLLLLEQLECLERLQLLHLSRRILIS